MNPIDALKIAGYEVTQEILTAGEPFNAYTLYWRVMAWRDEDVIAMVDAIELADAYQLLANRVGVRWGTQE